MIVCSKYCKKCNDSKNNYLECWNSYNRLLTNNCYCLLHYFESNFTNISESICLSCDNQC